MVRKVPRMLPVVAALCFVTGCGASAASPATVRATAAIGDPSALSARLLDAASLPRGFTAELPTATTMKTDPDAGAQIPASDVPCSDQVMGPLLSATRLAGTPSAKAVENVDIDTPGHFWVGEEALRTYTTDDEARKALTELRSLVGRCPEFEISALGDSEVWRYAVGPGPRLGDESVRLSCSMGTGSDMLRCDAVLIRTGSSLVAVMDMGEETGNEEDLDQVAAAAFARFQATGD